MNRIYHWICRHLENLIIYPIIFNKHLISARDFLVGLGYIKEQNNKDLYSLLRSLYYSEAKMGIKEG